MFNEKLKSLRKQAGLSQEKLAEKLNVSRQAVTKWETGGGLPETESLIAIAALFNVSVDELINSSPVPSSSIYESVTEYDIDGVKKFDVKIGNAERVKVCGVSGEKLRVVLRSRGIADLSSVLKIKIDDIKKAIDVEMKNFGRIPEGVLKNELDVFIGLPEKYIAKAELAANTRLLEIDNICNIEFDGKAEKCVLGRVEKAELNCGCDTDVTLKDICDYLELNQLYCTSRLWVPEGSQFRTLRHGIKTKILFDGAAETKQAEKIIEFNGINAELVIYKIF